MLTAPATGFSVFIAHLYFLLDKGGAGDYREIVYMSKQAVCQWLVYYGK
jgi:hypothetical protein